MFGANKFMGAIPRVAPHLLPDGYAQAAVSCDLDKGTLRPLLNHSTVATPTKVGTKLTIFPYGANWFHWLEDVDVVRAPLAGDTLNRVYFTGQGAPKATDASIATTGGTNYPMASYALGIPAPTTAPLTGTTGTATEPVDPATQEERQYVVTYVSAWGEESPPSPPSTALTWSPGETVEVQSIPAVPSGDYNIVAKRIYRTLEGEFLFVAEIDDAPTAYSDTVASSALGEALPSSTWYPPSATLTGLRIHPAGFLVGFDGKALAVSEPYLPHAWDANKQIVVDANIVGIEIFGQNILVATADKPYVVSGTDPGSLSVERIETGEKCLSKRGMADMGDFVVYPSPVGLVAIGLGVNRVLTEKMFTAEEWLAFSPATMHGVCHQGKYYGFHATGCLIIDPKEEPTVITDNTVATAAYSDGTDLYLMVGSNIVKWGGAGTSKTYLWRSKVERTQPTNHARAQVFADGLVTLRLYAGGVLKHTQTVADSDEFPLPSGFLADEWYVELEGTATVREFAVGEVSEELA